MIFQLHSFDFPVAITVSVIQHFPVSVLVKVNCGLFFSYCAISISVTVNRNNTAVMQSDFRRRTTSQKAEPSIRFLVPIEVDLAAGRSHHACSQPTVTVIKHSVKEGLHQMPSCELK